MNEDAIFILNDGVEVGVSSESIDYFLQKNPDAVLKEGTGPKPITVDFENENGFKTSIAVDDVEDFKSRYSGYKYVNKDDEAFVNQYKPISKEERTAELNQTFKSEDLQMNEEDFVMEFEDLLNANGLNVRSLGSGDEIEISTKKTISTARGRQNTTGGLIPVSKMTFDLGSGDYNQLNEFISSNADLDYVNNSKKMLPNFKDEYITKMSSTRLKPIKAREQYKINLTKKFEAQEFLDKNPSKTQVLGGGMMISVNTEDPELTDKEKQLYKLWSNGKPIPDLTDEELNLYIDKNYLDNRKRNSSSIFNQFDSKKQRKAAQAIAYDTIENEPDRLLNSKSNVEDYGKKLKDKSEQYKENVNVFNDKFKPFLDEKAGGYVIEKEEDIRLFNDQRKVLMKDLNVILEDEQKLDLLVSNYSSRVDEFSKELPYMPLALENAGKNYNRVEQLLTTAKSYGVGALYGVANIGRLIAGLDRSSISSYALLTEDVNKELSQFQYTPTMSESDTANDYARWFATSSLNAAVSLSIAATGSYAALPAFFLIGAGSSGAETQTSQINATKRIAEKSEQFEKDGFKFNGKELSIEQLDRVEAAYGTEFRKQLVDDFRLINLTERQILSQELLAGSSELIFEKLTTLNFLGGMKSAMGFYAVKDIKSAWRAAGKQTFKGATTEPLGEMATELTVNIGSVKILGEDINVFDNVAEVGWQALIPGLGMGLYSGSKIVDKAFTLENLSQGELNRSIEIKKEIDELLKDYKQGDKLPPKVQELVNELVKQNKQLEDRLLTDIREGKLSENDIQEIGEQNRILRKQLLFAEEINNDPSLSNIEKKKLLDEAKSIFDKAHNEREDILSKRRGRKPKTTEQKKFDFQTAILQYRSNSSYIKTADEKWRKLSNKDKSKEYDRVREEARLKGEKITDAEVEKTAISQFRKKEVSSQYEANKKDGLKFLEDLNSKEGLNLGIDYVELDLKEGEVISQYNVDEYSMKIYGKKFKDLNKKQKGETFAFLTSDKINADGFYENGKIVINKNVSISNGAVGVWQHEILHAIVEKQRKLNPSQAISEGKVLLDFLEKNNPNIYLSIKNRLDGPTYTNKETGVVQYDEVLTMLSDVFQAKDMSENVSMIDQLTSFVNKYLPSGKKIPRSDGAKIYDFVKNFSKSSGNTVRSSPNTSSPKSAIDLESSKAKSKELDTSTKFSKTEGIAQTLNELVPENSTKESWIKGGVAEAFLAINDKGILDGSIKNNLNKRGVTITPDLIQKIRDKIIDNLLTAYDPTNAAGLGGYLIGGNKKDKTSFRGKLNFIIGDVIGDEMNQPKTFSTDVEMSGREGQSIATQVPDTSVKETAQERKQKEKKNKEVVSGKKGVQGKTRTPLYKAIRFENDETINSLRDIIENILLKIDISVLENQKNFIAKFREELTGRYYVKDSSGKTKPKVSLKDAWVLVKREAGWPNKAVYESFLIKNKKALLNGFTTTYLSKNFPATIEKFVVEGLDSNGITKGKFTTAWNPKAKTGKKPGNIDFIAPTGDVAQLKGNTSGLQRMKRVEEVESMISNEQWIDHFKVGSKPWPQMKNETIWREIAGEVGYEIFQEEINKFDDLLDQTDSILNDDSLSKLQKKSKIEELESSDEFKIVSKFLYSQDLLQQEQINSVIASINDSLQRGITKFSDTKAPEQLEQIEEIENKEQRYVPRNIGVLIKEQESEWNIFNNVKSFALVLEEVTSYKNIKNKKDKQKFLDGLGKDKEFIHAVILDMELNKLLGERPAGPLAEIMFYQSWLPKNTETFGVSEKQPQGYSPGKGDIEMYYRVNGKKSTFKVEIKSTINGTISSTVIPSKLYDILNEEGIFNGKTIPDNESGNTISFIDFIKTDASEYFKAFAESYNKLASAIKDKDNLEIKGSTFFKDLFKKARTEANNKQVKKGGNITLEEKKNRQPTLKFKLTGKQFEEIFINSYVNSNTKMIIVAELGFKAFALTKEFADATGLPLFGLSTESGTYPEANVYMTISTGGPKAKLGKFDLTYGSIRGHIVIDTENRKQILINGGGNDLNLSTENKQLQEQIVNKLSGKLSVTHGLPIDPSLVPGVKFSKTDFARKKAIMVVGGIGSGKTTIINKIIDKLNLKRLGFNVVDEDVERSRIQQDKTISETSAYQNARKSVKKRLNDLSDNGDGIIYDNVGGNRNLTTKKVDELKSKGYDVSMILVDTNVEIAKKRDAARDRSMGDFMVEFSNGLVERRKNLYAKDFKGNFALINTDNLDLKQGLPLPFVEKVKSIIKYAVTSEDLSDRFNDIIQETKGVNAGQTFSDSLAQQKGARIGNYKFFVPPSADDFMGLMYAFMGKGSIGELHEDFFEAALNGPYKRGVAGLESAKQKMDDDYKALKKRYPKIAKKLGKKIPGMEYTYDQAIRVYLWKFNSEVFDVDLVKTVGLDQSEINDLFFTVANDVELQGFARGLGLLTNLPKGYIDPSSTWLLDNIASDLNNISEKVSRKKFLSEFILNTEAIFSKENLNKIQAIYGTKFRSALEDSLYAMKNGTSRNFGDNQIANQFADWLNGSVGAIMFINARSASLQLLSTINYINWSDNNMLTAAARFADQKQFWADFQKIINSDKLRQRRKGLSTDVQAAELANSVATSKSQYKSALRYLLRIGFTPTQAADAIAISFGGASFYRNRIKTYEKSFSKEEAERKAWEDFVKITDATQQSADASMVSQQQRNPLTRFILAFQNTAMQYNRVMKKSFLNLINRRGSDRENISKIIYYGAVQNFIFNAVQQAMFAMIWGVDESDEKEEERFWKLGNGMLDTILRGSGWKGAVISNLKNTILRYQKEEAKGNFKADHLVTAIQLFNVAPSVGSKLDKLYGAYKTNWYERDVIKAKGHSFDSPIWMVYGKLASATLNIPADRVVSKINNLVMASKSYTDAWQKVALTAGWSSWSLGLKNIENEGIKSRGAKARKKAGIEKAKITRAKTTAENKKEREAKEQRNSGVRKRQSTSRTSTTRRSFDR